MIFDFVKRKTKNEIIFVFGLLKTACSLSVLPKTLACVVHRPDHGNLLRQVHQVFLDLSLEGLQLREVLLTKAAFQRPQIRSSQNLAAKGTARIEQFLLLLHQGIHVGFRPTPCDFHLDRRNNRRHVREGLLVLRSGLTSGGDLHVQGRLRLSW